MKRTTISLCNTDELEPIMLDARDNPAFPTNTDAGAYMDLDECRELALRTLKHLGTPLADSDLILVWDKKGARHGEARRVSSDLDNVRQLNAEYRRLKSDYRAGRIGLETFMGFQRDLAAKARGSVAAALSDKGMKYQITLSSKVFSHVAPEDRAQTIIHEACHVAAFLRWPTKSVGHGPQWQDLMRYCGVPPDAKAQAHAGVPRIICPKCGQAGRLTPQSILTFRAGASGICRGCGGQLAAANMDIPEAYEGQIARARDKSARFHCPCGHTTHIPANALRALKAGRVRASCPRCRAPLGLEDIRVGGKPLEIT